MRAARRLDLRELFAQPWEGEGKVERPWWLRWLPMPVTFRFRSEIANVHGDAWDVLDTTTFPDGAVQRRWMHARQITPDRVKLVADDMPNGAEVRVHDRGFEFTPYLIRVRVGGPLHVPVRHLDTVRLADDGEMIDTIELRVLGVRVGDVTMRLRRCADAAT
jgi:hypothetical protein